MFWASLTFASGQNLDYKPLLLASVEAGIETHDLELRRLFSGHYSDEDAEKVFSEMVRSELNKTCAAINLPEVL